MVVSEEAAVQTAAQRRQRDLPRAAAIARGTARLLARAGMASVGELPLPNGRRADMAGLSETGEIWIIEIKSSAEDFRADAKWPEYRGFCDRRFFAVDQSFPRALLPADTGLILADRYGGEIVRDAPLHKLAGARRKRVVLCLARAAAWRLLHIIDPGAGLEKMLQK